jgi:hypothetical protein
MTDTSPVEFDKDGWPERLILSRDHQSEIVEYMQPWGEADAEDRLYIRADTIAALRAAPVAMRECDHPFCGDKCGSDPLDAPAPVDPTRADLERCLTICLNHGLAYFDRHMKLQFKPAPVDPVAEARQEKDGLSEMERKLRRALAQEARHVG